VALLKGLEITVIPLSEVRRNNRVFRVDAQYFGKAALAVEAQIKRGKWEELREAASGIESFGAYALTNEFSYVDAGIPFLRCLNIRDGFTDFTDVLHITPQAHSLLAKSEVRPGMLLLTMSGSVGNVSVALDSWRYPINSNQDIAKITTKKTHNPFYLAAFLGSRLGQIQMRRLPVGSVQQHIFLWMIERIAVSRFSAKFEQAVAEIVKSALKLDVTSGMEAEQAEGVLLHALGLQAWHSPDPLTYTRRASEVFHARRLDAEYFAPRVLDLLARLGTDGSTVGEVASPRYEQFVAGSKGEFSYIEISAVRRDGTALADRLPQSEAPSRAKWHVRSHDIITSTVRPIRRLSAVIDPEQDGFVCSSGFLVLRPQKVPPEILLTYLRLLPVCELMDVHTSASMYPAIAERDILQLPFKRVSKAAEDEIVQAVRRAHSVRRESRSLLEHAKKAVEIAVEQNEAAALKLIDKKLG
jgi:hypothetical protein